MLGVKYDRFTHTSDHFDILLDYCKQLIEKGVAYCDDTEPELMKQQREQRHESVNRNNSVEKNLKLWSDMIAGNEQGQKCCVRLKINMNANNGCMRDPTIYRCKPEEHVRTGNKYKYEIEIIHSINRSSCFSQGSIQPMILLVQLSIVSKEV